MITLICLLIVLTLFGVRGLINVIFFGVGGALLALSIAYFVIPMIEGGMK